MKKTFKAFWLALVGVVWLFLMASSCHKTPEPEPDLPPETQTAAGTVGCYINGKPWWPKPYLSVLGTPYLEVEYGGANPESFYLRSKIPPATSQIKGTGLLTIQIPTFAKKGDNVIWYNPFQSFIFTSYDTVAFTGNCGQFRLDTLKTRRLTITKLDTVGVGIIAGTFEFTAIDKCGNILHFTQGRFDY